MTEKPIYLTTKRLLYNIARVDFSYERVSEEYVEKRKMDWENEYNQPDYEKRFGPKKFD
jgi:hypothetical protein